LKQKWGQRWLRPPPQTALQRDILSLAGVAVKKEQKKKHKKNFLRVQDYNSNSNRIKL